MADLAPIFSYTLSIGIPIDDVTAKPSDEGDSGLRWVEFWLD